MYFKTAAKLKMALKKMQLQVTFPPKVSYSGDQFGRSRKLVLVTIVFEKMKLGVMSDIEALSQRLWFGNWCLLNSTTHVKHAPESVAITALSSHVLSVPSMSTRNILLISRPRVPILLNPPGNVQVLYIIIFKLFEVMRSEDIGSKTDSFLKLISSDS